GAKCSLISRERLPMRTFLILLPALFSGVGCIWEIDPKQEDSSSTDLGDTPTGDGEPSPGEPDTSGGGSDTSIGDTDSGDEEPLPVGDNICDQRVPRDHHIGGIPAYEQCDESREANIWTNDGLNTSTERQGPGWILTQTGVQEGGSGGYQCTELAIRYLRYARGVTDWPVGKALNWCEGTPSQLEKPATPIHGDIVVYHPGSCGASTTTGHVAVVDVVDDAAQTFEALNQNSFGRKECSFSDANCFLRPVN
ncbi:MAG: CHAP domain-containing protein, partial [Myxococcota bacterium]|nr:CHAP domain-containing protein [Myxococcota bacterium]